MSNDSKQPKPGTVRQSEQKKGGTYPIRSNTEEPKQRPDTVLRTKVDNTPGEKKK